MKWVILKELKQMSMLQKFYGEENKHKLINALKKQEIIAGKADLALEIARDSELIEYSKDEVIIVQDNIDDDILFILAGKVSIVVNGREMAIRSSGQHVGEMALIDPSLRRSASVIALGVTVVAKISEAKFSPIADKYPDIWKCIAEILSKRLIERNALVDVPNPRPKIFIGSSSEALSIARAIQSSFQHDEYLVRVWTDKVFGASSSVIDDLEYEISSSDFAILVISADDHIISRNDSFEAPRDNVIFELGLFMGSLTRRRTFIAIPNKSQDLKIPSDLLGITPLVYKSGDPDDLPSLIAPMCTEIRNIIRKLGTK